MTPSIARRLSLCATFALGLTLGSLFQAGCTSAQFDPAKIDTTRAAATGGRLATSLILQNNPDRDTEILQIADSLSGLFVDQELTDQLVGDLALRLAVRVGLKPAEAAGVKGAIMELWAAIKPAFGDGPILATDPRVHDAIAAFANGMRATVADYRQAVEISVEATVGLLRQTTDRHTVTRKRSDAARPSTVLG